MPPISRQYQARQLYECFDDWLDQRLTSKPLTLQWLCDSEIKIYHNSQLVSDIRCGNASIVQSEHNHIECVYSGKFFSQFMIDNFDCLDWFTHESSRATLNFMRPFTLWTANHTSSKSSQLLADHVNYDEQSQKIVENLLTQVSKLKY